MAPPRAQPPEPSAPRPAPRAVLAITFLFMLAAVSVSTGLVVHAAYLHDLENGLFAIAFAVLSARAALSWRLWHHSCQQSALSRREDPGDRKLANRES